MDEVEKARIIKCLVAAGRLDQAKKLGYREEVIEDKISKKKEKK